MDMFEGFVLEVLCLLVYDVDVEVSLLVELFN